MHHVSHHHRGRDLNQNRKFCCYLPIGKNGFYDHNEKAVALLVRPPQTVDKTKVFRQMDESFGQAFSKACAVEAAEASSRSAEREITFAAFLFANFFFAPLVSKKKWRMKFVHCYKLYTFGLQPEELPNGSSFKKLLLFTAFGTNVVNGEIVPRDRHAKGAG